jgi:hypothetical protein
VIHAGHGNGDPGASLCPGKQAPGIGSEADINIAVANKVADILRGKGYDTIDVFRDRDPSLKGLEADAFVSIHCDQCTLGRTGYKVSRYGGAPGTGLNGSGDASNRLVQALWDEYGKATGLQQDTVPGHFTDNMTKNYALVWISPSTPGVIIEMGWLSGDWQALAYEQDKLAVGIANGILKFLGDSTIPVGIPPILEPQPSIPPIVATVVPATVIPESRTPLIAQLGGFTLAVHVAGNYAYIGEGPSLVILDIAKPASPTVVGRTGVLPYTVTDVYVVGDYAYVTAGDSLHVISVVDKVHPSQVGHFNIMHVIEGVSVSCVICAEGVHVVGDYAYVAAGEEGLRVISVADKSNPREVGFFDTPGSVQAVYIVGDYAYVVAWGEGLRVISVADKSNPREVGFLDMPFAFDKPGSANVHVVGDYAYVAAGEEGLRVISVADKSNPREVGFLDMPAYEVYVVGDYAYVDGLRVISVADKSNLREVGFFDTPGTAHAVYVVGDYAYVAAWEEGLRVISVADKSNPREVGFFAATGPAEGVHVVGDYAYIATQNGLHVISVADKSNPREVSFFDTPGNAADVHVVGDYAYVVAWGGGFHVISVADKSNPREVGFLDFQGDIMSVHVVGDYAYVAGGGGLRVVSVADKLNPRQVGSFAPGGHAKDVHVVGDYAYVADEDGLNVISVVERSKPRKVGFLDTPGGARGVYVVGDYAYVAVAKRGLSVISVADKAYPREVGFCDMPKRGVTVQDNDGSEYVADPVSVQVLGDRAYVADSLIGLRVISVADKLHPSEVGFFVMTSPSILSGPGPALDMHIVGDYAYIATYYGGLVILRIAQ